MMLRWPWERVGKIEMKTGSRPKTNKATKERLEEFYVYTLNIDK